MKLLILLPFLLGLISPAIAHNEANGGCETWEYDTNQECLIND